MRRLRTGRPLGQSLRRQPVASVVLHEGIPDGQEPGDGTGKPAARSTGERVQAGVECRKDEGVLDETPAAYKDIDAVMAAQASLVDIVHTLKQVVCVKG